MNILLTKLTSITRKAGWVIGLGSLIVVGAAHASVAQSPLLLGGGNVPGNLVLTPSVEFPTVISIANLGNYDIKATYAGYFDSAKCYDYEKETFTHNIFGEIKKKDGGGYFTPKNFDFKKNGSCGGKWSGHYLNWAATQTIDPFRKALTGGYRVVDEVGLTILEKATRAGRTGLFENRYILDGVAEKVSPYNVRLNSSVTSGDDYQKNKTLQIKREQKEKNKTETITEYYSVRVEVCKKGLLEDNCKQYGENYKPEGLLQEYADDIRYSVFSYLNIDGNNIDGGVLRSPQDYIGTKKREPSTPGTQNNPYQEWNPNTGVLKDNPRGDPTGNSGVINYINKFGEISNQHKSNDPVSELYYAALRYLRGKPNLSAYTTPATTNEQKDYFPVITEWVDPMQYTCQKSAILGIGDANTHEDRNLLPGDDKFINLNNYTKKVFDLEDISKSASDVFTGRGNSAYIAGLAYYANIEDIRTDMLGKQTVSTYWVDVRENKILEGRKSNQYWLAAKYGGFDVPKDYVFGGSLNNAWWTMPGDKLSTGDQRPSNFYVASDAEAMVNSLSQAFAKIASEVQSTTTALAANSSRLETGTAVFQSRLNNKLWSGDLLALQINAQGVVSAEPAWSAAVKLDGLTGSDFDSRNILSITPSAASNIANTGIQFKWTELSSAQKAQLTSEDHLNYLRGDRTNERNSTKPNGKFRERGSRLGDIVNSDPQFVHQQNYGYTRLASWNNKAVANKYSEFRDTAAYKARVPMVIVGANDGMLHGFDASLDNGGSELFAFVPNGAMANLSNLADLDYTHRYYVDGTPRVADAWLGSKWATVAVGTMGAGGNSVFAIDVTNVSGKNSISKDNVMWEFSDPRMGYSMGQPAIVALPNKKFGVIVSSGYHNTAPDKGYVWILDVSDGSIIKEFELNTQGNLGTVLATDLNGNAEADRLYIPDTQGNVWRIDLVGESSSWAIPGTLGDGPLFIVKDADGNRQAITAPLASAFNQWGQHMLLFGTGSYYRVGDNEVAANPPVETFYGLFDTGSLIEGRDSLLKQSILAEATKNGKQLRAVTDNKLVSQSGWYLDLAFSKAAGGPGPKGERVLAQASLRSDRVVFTTMTPVDDPCLSGGTSMIMVLDLSSGQRLKYAYFDVDGDGNLGDGDYHLLPGDDGELIPWSGMSDADDGVIKGVSAMYKWMCYAGSSGEVKCVPVAGSIREGRQSWREVRDADE